MNTFIASPDGVMFFRRASVTAIKRSEEKEAPIVQVWTNSDDSFLVRGFPNEEARDSWIDELIDPAVDPDHIAHLPPLGEAEGGEDQTEKQEPDTTIT